MLYFYCLLHFRLIIHLHGQLVVHHIRSAVFSNPLPIIPAPTQAGPAYSLLLSSYCSNNSS